MPSQNAPMLPVPGNRPIHVGAVVRDGRVRHGLSDRFLLGPGDWKHHMAVLGGTGGGKSKFLERFCQGLLYDGQGGILIDPHGDLAINLLSFIGHRHTRKDEIWRRVHYLELGTKGAFSYDPFAHAPRRMHLNRPELDIEYYAWLHAKVDRVVRAILRRVSEADMEIMNRLIRWLQNVIYACGVAVDDRNTHLGLDHALLFTNPGNNDNRPFFDVVQPHLPKEIQADFQSLIETKSAQNREKWVESTINRLRRILSPLMKTVFGQHGPSIDLPQIIRDRGFIIANLSEKTTVSFDAKTVLGGLLIDEVLVSKIAEEDLPEHERVPFTMIIDESGEFLGEDLQRALGAVRKYKLSLVLAAQDLSTFAKGDLDLAPKVLSMCGTVLTFRQTYLKDKEILVDRVGSENIRFDYHMVEQQIQVNHQDIRRNYQWMQVEDTSEKLEVSEQENRSNSVGESDMSGSQSGHSASSMEGWAHARADQSGESEVVLHGEGHPSSKTKSASGSRSESRNKSSSQAENSSVSHALTKSRQVTEGSGSGRSYGQSISKKWVHLPILVSKWERAGLEAGTIPEQYERMMQQLHGLKMAEAVVSTLRIRGGFPVKIAHVPELFDPREKPMVVDAIRKLIRSQHPYNFSPVLLDPAEMGRLERLRIASDTAKSTPTPKLQGPSAFNED